MYNKKNASIYIAQNNRHINNNRLIITIKNCTEIFYTVDEFCKEFKHETVYFLFGNKPKRSLRMPSSEVLTISLLFHLSEFRCFKHFYFSNIQKQMQSEFPTQIPISDFIKLM